MIELVIAAVLVVLGVLVCIGLCVSIGLDLKRLSEQDALYARQTTDWTGFDRARENWERVR